MKRSLKPNARQRRALGPVLADPIPTYAEANLSEAERSDSAKLRSAFTRYQKKHGSDSLISFLRIELMNRGEERWLLDKLAPKPSSSGQTSILDAGR